jgi:hypothetical protein
MSDKFPTILRASLLAISVALLFAFLVQGAPNDFQIPWWSVDGGGGVSQSIGGEYTLQGAIGQADTGSSHGGDFGIEGGFWAGLREWVTQFFIHFPLVLR